MPSPRRLLARFAAALAAAVLLAPWPAIAQPSASPPDPPSVGEVGWTLVSGYSTASIRDVARTGPPVDASPIALGGEGPYILLRHDRATKVRLHRFELEFSKTGSLSYDSPVGSVAGPGGGHLMRLAGRYEYRRYLFRDLAINGLDIGLGVQGTGERLSFTREVPTAITIDQATLQAGAGVVAAARLHRWRRFDVEAAWVNSIFFGRTSTRAFRGRHRVVFVARRRLGDRPSAHDECPGERGRVAGRGLWPR